MSQYQGCDLAFSSYSLKCCDSNLTFNLFDLCKAQEEVTKAITQKPRMNDSGFRRPQQVSH